MCSADCLRIEKATKKGHPGATIACSVCLRSFHVKCMESEGFVTRGLTKVQLLSLAFSCSACGDTGGADRTAPVEVVELSRPVPEAQVAAEEPAALPSRRRAKARKRK